MKRMMDNKNKKSFKKTYFGKELICIDTLCRSESGPGHGHCL